MGQTIDYTLGIKNEAGDFTLLKEGKIVCSHYPRRLLVDEFTGMWCNDCPKGQIEVEKLKQQFGSQLIDIVPHINDMFECTDYRNGYQVYAVPYLVLNRNPATAGQSTRSFSKVYEDPTVSMIEITGYTIAGNRLDVKTRVHWAEDLDNSDDRYRVAYTLTRNVYTDEDISAIYQKNGAQGVSYGRFNVLPTKIPSYLTHLDNIPLTGLFSHTGVPYSLPASIYAGGYYDGEFSMEKPSMSEEVEWPSIKDYDLKDCRLVAYIVDSTNGHVLNAVEQYLDQPAPEPVSVISPEIDNASDIDAEPEYYNLQGLKVINPAAGIYIVRRGSKVSKVVVR